jgi:hypothetical protein
MGKIVERRSQDNLVEAKKVLLHISQINNNPEEENPQSDFVAIYEIVIFNNSNYNLVELSVKDSLMGLLTDAELNSGLTNVTVTSSTQLPVNNFNAIMANKNELLEQKTLLNTIPKNTIANLIVRITGKGQLKGRDPANNNLTGPITPANQSPYYVSNSAIISGKFQLCPNNPNKTKDFKPLYVKDEGWPNQ